MKTTIDHPEMTFSRLDVGHYFARLPLGPGTIIHVKTSQHKARALYDSGTPAEVDCQMTMPVLHLRLTEMRAKPFAK